MQRLKALLLASILCHPLWASAHEIVSLGPDNEVANGAGDQPAFSADGRYVAFASQASNLVPGDTNGMRDVYVRDLQTAVIERVSVATDGTQGNGNSSAPVISADGRHVVFLSQASNLAGADTGMVQKVLVRDRIAGTTTLLSVALNNANLVDPCTRSSVSGDGRYVVISCYASNLLANDVNATVDVILVDRGTPAADGAFDAAPVLSRVGEDNGTLLNAGSNDGVISGDGNWIAFSSAATNVGSPQTDTYADIFLKRRDTGVMTLVSANTDGNSSDPQLNYDGSLLVFASKATTLVAGDTNGVADIFLYARSGGSITLASYGAQSALSNGASGNPHISGDGRYVIFDSVARNIAARTAAARQMLPLTKDLDGYFDAVTSATGSGSGGGPIPQSTQYTYLLDRNAGSTRLVSTGVADAVADGNSYNSVISNDGTLVGFGSIAKNLVCDDTSDYGKVFVSAVAALSTTITCGDTTGTGTGPASSGGGGGAWSFPLLAIMVVFLLLSRKISGVRPS